MVKTMHSEGIIIPFVYHSHFPDKYLRYILIEEFIQLVDSISMIEGRLRLKHPYPATCMFS